VRFSLRTLSVLIRATHGQGIRDALICAFGAGDAQATRRGIPMCLHNKIKPYRKVGFLVKKELKKGTAPQLKLKYLRLASWCASAVSLKQTMHRNSSMLQAT
jgi:hypothetical protein